MPSARSPLFISCPIASAVPWSGYALHPLHLGKQHTLISGIWPSELKQKFPCSCHILCDPVNSSPGKLRSCKQELILGRSEAQDIIMCILIRRPERIWSEEAAARWDSEGDMTSYQLLRSWRRWQNKELEQYQTLADSSGSPRRHPCSPPRFPLPEAVFWPP